MPTYTAITTMPGKQAAEQLVEALEALEPAPYGVGIFEIEDGSGLWEVGAYFTDRPDDIALALLSAAAGARDFAVSEVPDIDWVAHVRRELSPVSAGRFFVYGSHDADKVPGGVVPLLIEAAMAFGTGHHGTTQGCLMAFDDLLTDGFAPARVADIGCGTAVLAMAAAKTLGADILASDIDEVAIDVTRVNMAVNGLDGRITTVVAAGLDHPDIAAAAPFDLIFANILKGPLVELAPAIAAHLSAGGYAILSGILIEQAEDVVAAYADCGLVLKARRDIGDWATLTFGKN